MPPRQVETINPQAGPPSSFPAWQDANRVGDTLRPYSDYKQPVYEQERFERRIGLAYLQSTGNGAASYTWEINPHPDYFTRINWAVVENNNVTDWTIRPTLNLTISGTARTVNLGQCRVDAVAGACYVISPQALVRTQTTDQSQWSTPGPVVLVPKKFQPYKSSLQVADQLTFSIGVIENTKVMKLLAEIELIPSWPDYTDRSQLLAQSAV